MEEKEKEEEEEEEGEKYDAREAGAEHKQASGGDERATTRLRVPF